MKPLGASDPREIGRYRVLAELGTDGMGRTFLGCGPDGRLVAVKQVHAQFAANEEFRAWFRREVAASRAVVGVHTAPVVDADPDGGIPWLASGFVASTSLRQAVDVTGTLPEDSVLRLAAGLAAALTEIHQAGLVHRDLTPSNVVLAEDGPRLTSFGITRAIDTTAPEMTNTGWLIGSPGFMSPEQADGQPLTPASDVFSLGCVLFMACTGEGPFDGPATPQTLYRVVHAEPDLVAIPERLRPIIQACLAKDPTDRPTPTQLLDRIGQITPSAQPWPPGVRGLIAAQDAEVARLQGAPADVNEHAENAAAAVARTRRPPNPTLIRGESGAAVPQMGVVPAPPVMPPWPAPPYPAASTTRPRTARRRRFAVLVAAGAVVLVAVTVGVVLYVGRNRVPAGCTEANEAFKTANASAGGAASKRKLAADLDAAAATATDPAVKSAIQTLAAHEANLAAFPDSGRSTVEDALAQSEELRNSIASTKEFLRVCEAAVYPAH
jgi:hypothetical protein